MKTSIYIDGFNLYYGALRGTPYKWLNPLELCQNILKPYHRFFRVRYFTALVTVRPNDPNQKARQESYIRAVLTLPNSSVIYGSFLSHPTRMRSASPNGPKSVDVLKTEEKGSDVNLATHMVHDGHRGEYECAVVISNDSDLVEPVRIVRHELGKTVVVLNPHQKSPSVDLKKVATFVRTIRKNQLSRAQFDDHLTDHNGKMIKKPASW